MGQEAVEALQAPAKLWALSGALYVHHQVSPSHADQKRIPEHLAGGSRQGINLSLRSSRAYIFQNHDPAWFLSSWLFSSFPASTRHTERQPQSKNQAVREDWLAALPRSGDKEHWHGWQECQAHPSSALAFG